MKKRKYVCVFLFFPSHILAYSRSCTSLVSAAPATSTRRLRRHIQAQDTPSQTTPAQTTPSQATPTLTAPTCPTPAQPLSLLLPAQLRTAPRLPLLRPELGIIALFQQDVLSRLRKTEQRTACTSRFCCDLSFLAGFGDDGW